MTSRPESRLDDAVECQHGQAGFHGEQKIKQTPGIPGGICAGHLRQVIQALLEEIN